MYLLTISNFSCAYGNTRILQSLNLSLASNQVISILGTNGAGKSTLLKSILGLNQQEACLSGEIKILGHNVVQAPLQARQYAAYLPEQSAVYGHLSAIENIGYFLSLSGSKPTISTIETYLTQVGLDQQVWHRPCSDYSKGMKQKVMLALALAKQAKLLLMDEPNSGLDPKATEELNQLIMHCKQQGIGVLVVTHDVLSALSFSDELYMLSNGQLSAIALDKSSLNFDSLTRLYQGQA